MFFQDIEYANTCGKTCDALMGSRFMEVSSLDRASTSIKFLKLSVAVYVLNTVLGVNVRFSLVYKLLFLFWKIHVRVFPYLN